MDERRKKALLALVAIIFLAFAAGTVVTAWKALGEGYIPGEGKAELVALLAFLTYVFAEALFFLREKFEGESSNRDTRVVVLIYLLMILLFMLIGIIYFGTHREKVEEIEEVKTSEDLFVEHLGKGETCFLPPKTEEDEPLPQTLLEKGQDAEELSLAEIKQPEEEKVSIIVTEYDFSRPKEAEALALEIEEGKEISIESVSMDVEEAEEEVVVEEEEIYEEAAETLKEECTGEEMLREVESVKIPTAPTILYDIPRLYEVLPPSMPSVSVSYQDVYEYEEWTPIYMDEDEDDFWASFYIAGEDELYFESGIYYMNLYVNGQQYGSIETYLEGSSLYLNTLELRSYVENTITDEARAMIFNSAEEFIGLDVLNNQGVEATYDLDLFNVYLTFSTHDMPLQIISISGSNVRSVSRPIANSTVLEPATFVLTSRYSIQASTSLYPFEDIWNDARLYISSYNTLRLFDIYGTFNYSFNLTPSSLSFAFGSYSFYKDFEDEMIRLSFGNVSPELLYPDGTSLGVRFDKSLSYANSNVRRRSHIERYITIEKESDVRVVNEGREIYRRTLGPGNYRLEDFVLYSGANKIEIIISPLDGSEVITDTIDLVYSSSLLAPGEMYYGGGLFTGRNLVRRSSDRVAGTLRIPYSSDYAVDYDARNLVLSGYLRAGLTTSLTMNTSFAFKNSAEQNDYFNPRLRYALELTHANILGTTRYNFNLTENADDGFTLPTLYARVSHQAYTGIREFSSINASVTYNGSATGQIYDSSRLSGNLNFSGSFSFLSWSLGLSGALNLNYLEFSTWYTSATLSATLGSNFYLSLSATLSGVGNNEPTFTGRISGTLRLGSTRTTASYANNYSSLSFTHSGHGNYVDVRLNTTNILRAESYDLSAQYSHTSDNFNFSLSLNASDLFERNSLSFSSSFATVFADGLFAFSSFTPTNFLLIQQRGALKGNKLSIGSIGTSRPDEVAMFFNTGVYTGLSLGRSTSLSIFSAPEDSFSSATSFDITIPDSRLGGYILRIESENRYSITGVAYRSNGDLWINASSPVYSVTVNDDNSISLEMTEYYLFTDQDGRFIVSDLTPGLYAFDVDNAGSWEMHIFNVLDNPEETYNIQILEDSHISNYSLPEPYSASYEYVGESYMNYEEFWNMLYPIEEVAV